MLADTPQIAREIPRRGVALLRILLQTPLDDPTERRRHVDVDRSDGIDVFADDRGESFGAGAALERALSGRHLVENRAERELIGAEVEGLAARLLRRHVPHRTHHGSGLRLLRRLEVG